MLATVHWAAQEDTAAVTDPEAAIAGVQSWSDRKYEQRGADNIGELINMALEAIEEHPTNKAKLDGVFRNIDFNSEANLGKTKDRNRRLKNLLEDFANPKLDLRPSRVSEDIIGNAYIYLIERFATGAGKKAGEFFTPEQISKLIAKLAQPKPGDRICDPFVDRVRC